MEERDVSGGSLGYVGRAMEFGGEGLLDLEWALRALPDKLSRCLAVPVHQLHNEAYDSAPLVTPYSKAVPYYRPIAEDERADVARYGKQALRMMQELLSTVDDLRRRAATLAPLANVLDRRGSGDDGDEDVWEAILSWGRERESSAGKTG